MSDKYDYIILGGGLSGLMLAQELMQSELLPDKHILIIDRERKNSNDRTWSFWARPEFYIPPMAHTSWTHFDSYYGDQYFHQSFSPYHYYSIRSSDFYRHVHDLVDQNKSIDIIQDEMLSINEMNGVVHLASGQSISADIIFNSAYDVKDLDIQEPYINLWQHFKGWIIKTEHEVFNRNTATLMDFRTEQYEDVRFFYILPFSSTEALVEYTGFSPSALDQDTYDIKLKDYISNRLGIEEYSIEETEYGVIPMTDFPFSPEVRGKVVPIGTAGGYVKASTGYSFTRTVRRIRRLVKSLEQSPQSIPNTLPLRSTYRFRMYDTIFLEVMKSNMHSMDRIFYNLYAYKSKNLVFKFLDEETSMAEDIQIMSACPFDFYKAMFRRLRVMKKI